MFLDGNSYKMLTETLRRPSVTGSSSATSTADGSRPPAHGLTASAVLSTHRWHQRRGELRCQMTCRRHGRTTHSFRDVSAVSLDPTNWCSFLCPTHGVASLDAEGDRRFGRDGELGDVEVDDAGRRTATVLDRAKRDGTADPRTGIDDLLRLVTAIAWASQQTPEVTDIIDRLFTTSFPDPRRS